MHFVFRNDFNIGAWNPARFIRPKDLFGPKGFGSDPFRKNRLNPARLSAFHSVTYLELVILQQGDEASPEAEKS